MLRLLIVDDEEVICQTIARLIDWQCLGVELIGTCCDGVEAYHAILDECPDLVMTDIRMPGISGLELIERISKTDLNVHFIILSGYGEFDYAKRAMHCGIRHYLLKPCDEGQIISCVREVIEECRHDSFFSSSLSPQGIQYQKLQQKLVQSILFEGCGLPQLPPSFFLPYEKYLDLTHTSYELGCFYYLEEKNLQSCLEKVSGYLSVHAPALPVYQTYVSNILLIFYPVSYFESHDMTVAFQALHFPDQTVSIQYEVASFSDFTALLIYLIKKLRRYDVLYFLDENRIIPHYNYDSITTGEKQFLTMVSKDESHTQQALENLEQLLSSISNPDFLVQLADNLIITLSTRTDDFRMDDCLSFLGSLRLEKDPIAIRKLIYGRISSLLFHSNVGSASYSPFIEKTIRYLKEHLSDPCLTLKGIAENYLYMNVNYVSRCFVKETGQTFSSFLAQLRIDKAKEIFSSRDSDRIKNVATLVGCGNNPYYFSRLFKKYTGLTPSAYLRKLPLTD